MSKEDLSKLPKWARHEIEKLRANVEWYKEKANQVQGKSETNVFLSNGVDDAIPLPKDSRIIFATDNKKRQYEQLHVQILDEGIEIHGSDTLKITPHASNTIFVGQEKRK